MIFLFFSQICGKMDIIIPQMMYLLYLARFLTYAVVIITFKLLLH